MRPAHVAQLLHGGLLAKPLEPLPLQRALLGRDRREAPLKLELEVAVVGGWGALIAVDPAALDALVGSCPGPDFFSLR